MARLQDFQTVTPSAANDNLLIVQAAGQGLAKIDAVGQKIATDTTVSSLNTSSKKIAGAINELSSGKANKSAMFKSQVFTKVYSVAGNGTVHFDASFITVPSGYRIAGIISVSPNQESVCLVSVRPEDTGEWAFQLKNTSPSPMSNQNFRINVLFIKNEFFG